MSEVRYIPPFVRVGGLWLRPDEVRLFKDMNSRPGWSELTMTNGEAWQVKLTADKVAEALNVGQ